MNESFYNYWGKAKPSSEDGVQYHLLPYHCLDVAAVASEWWDNSHAIRCMFVNIAKLNEVQTKAWLLFFVALHDYGKFDVRFQLKAPEPWKALNQKLSRCSLQLNDVE